MKRWFLATLLVCGTVSAKLAPSFRGELLKGGRTSLDSLIKPNRLVLLSFWATWCVPCLQELTHVTDHLKKEPTLPLDIVSVNIDREDRSEVPVLMQQLGFGFPVVMDPTQEVFGKYQKAGTLPYSVLINPNREIEAEFSGYHESMFEQIRSAVRKLPKGS